MAGGIFLSYRRDDSRHVAGRLVDRLAQTFKRDQLFMDVDAIEPGLDFVKVLTEKVRDCDVFLAVIGPQWINATDANGRKRLDDPNDFVRVELEAALQRDIRVIPVLVDGAQMPLANELPEPLRPLARRNAVRLTHERFGSEATALATSLKGVVSKKDGGWWRPAGNAPGANSGSGMAAGEERAAVTLRLKERAETSSRPRYRAGKIALIAFAGSAFLVATWFALGRIENAADFVMLQDAELTGDRVTLAAEQQTPETCAALCQSTDGCNGFALQKERKYCYLVSAIKGETPNTAFVSGKRR